MSYFTERPSDKKQLEEGDALSPKFDEHGLIPCITIDHASGAVLMFAYMNDLSLSKTIETGMVHYWSRSRGKLWLKGESSGLTQKVEQLLIDCDQDVIQARVTVGSTSDGVQASCHTGHPNCFFREIPVNVPVHDPLTLKTISKKVFDPEKVYGK